MKALKTLLGTLMAISVGLLAAQLSAAKMSDQEVRAEFKGHLDHARQLLDDRKWEALATEAQEILDTSKTIDRRSVETKKGPNMMHFAIQQNATRLAAAAHDENPTEAKGHCNGLAACLQPKP